MPDSEPPPSTGGTGATGGTTGGVGGVGTGGTGGSFTGGVGGGVGGAGGAVGGTGGAAAGVGGAAAGVGGAAAGVGGSAAGVGGAAVGGTAGTGTAGTGTAGTGAAGAPAVSCDAAFAVGADGFVRAPAAGGGCWHGYASAGGDTGSMIMPTSFGSCGAGCMLRVSGTVGPATEANSYAGVAYLGFNLNQAAGASAKTTVVPTGTGLAVQYTNPSANAVVRVQISSGSSAATRWCAPLTSTSATIPYAMFNTQCWEGGAGTAYAKEPIDTVQLVIPGGEAEAAVDITLVSVQDM